LWCSCLAPLLERCRPFHSTPTSEILRGWVGGEAISLAHTSKSLLLWQDSQNYSYSNISSSCRNDAASFLLVGRLDKFFFINWNERFTSFDSVHNFMHKRYFKNSIYYQPAVFKKSRSRDIKNSNFQGPSRTQVPLVQLLPLITTLLCIIFNNGITCINVLTD